MKLEKLSLKKFAPLTVAQTHKIRGGSATGGGQRILSAERFRDATGAAMIIYQYETWTSDDIGGGTECYYGIGTKSSGPVPY